jgi:hypothetical protein
MQHACLRGRSVCCELGRLRQQETRSDYSKGGVRYASVDLDPRQRGSKQGVYAQREAKRRGSCYLSPRVVSV